jgi:hypothetical protein
MMRADYDSEADAIAITVVELEDDHEPAKGDAVHERCTVALVDGKVVDVEILYPALGLDEPLAKAAARYALDLEALTAAARSSLAAPNRVITLDVAARR